MSEEDPVQEWIPIRPSSRDVIVSGSGYIVTTFETETAKTSLNGGEFIVYEKLGVILFCQPSPEAFAAGIKGQDALSATKLSGDGDKEYLLLTVADGVGQSYLGELAAGLGARVNAERGGPDLLINLKQVDEELMSIDNRDLPKPNTRVVLIDEALNKTRLENGSCTTLNQLLVDTGSGQVKGLFHGDGYLAVVTDAGEVMKQSTGKRGVYLRTSGGLQGESEGYEHTLEKGDVLLLYSDGLDGLGERELSQIAERLRGGGDFNVKAKSLIEFLITIDDKLRDDDRSLIAYVQR